MTKRVVAIGASAGGLKALQELLGQLRPGNEAAFVVAQHLSPDHASQLTSLLARVTKLKVVEACDGLPLSPGHILVVPPNFDATIESGCLKLSSPPPRFGPSPCIDRLFDSLASACGEHAVAVVLSGTGSDGAFGLRAVRAGGGLTLVQTPESALFSAMPCAAISLGSPDLVADPETLGFRLAEWLISGENWTHSPTDSLPLFLSSVAAQLKQLTGVDFSQYKESTLLRQVHRRMAVNGIQTMDEYMKLLSSNASESHALMQNLLVTVTSFFRDPEGFEALEAHLKVQLGLAVLSGPYRVWVPGCATGEEAYSIGMLVSKVMGHPENLSQRLKIFATDLDEQSLAIARKAIYPASALTPIPDDLKKRFVLDLEGDGDCEIHKNLRSCLVFARHNVCEDPPFPDVNLVSCRNLLIYFTPNLQQRVIDLLGFSLQPGGILFLGSSESLAHPSGFRVLNPLHRLYERNEQERKRLSLPTGLSSRTPSSERPAMSLAKQSDLLPVQHIQLIEVLIRVLGKPCLVLDQNHVLVEVIGDVSPFCRMPEGRLTGAAISFLRDELQSEARALLLLVKAGNSPVSSNCLRLPSFASLLRLEAMPIQVGDQDLIVLSFIEEIEQDPSPTSSLEPLDRNSVFTLEIERLEHELLSSQDTLRRSLLNLEQANEELEASSEELQASSEELQSSNEELEASNEELQAANDELALLNQQLRIRGDELERLNRDLENIQRSFNQGMVIVDEDLRITRFSPLAVRVFGLVQADIGASLVNIPTTVPIQGLRDSLLKVIHGGERCNLQAQSGEVSYLMQLMPYRNTDNDILGVIITLTDISELTAIRQAAESSLQEFECLADMLEQAVWKRDHTLTRFLYISARVEPLVGWNASEICAMASLLDSAILPADRGSVMAARRSDQAGWDVTYRITRRDGEIRTFREVAIRLDEGTSEGTVVGTLTDITDQQLLLQRNQFLAGAFRSLIQTEHQPVALLDASLRVMFINDSFVQCLHTPSPELQGRPLDEVAQALVLHPDCLPQEKPSSERLRSVAAQVMESNQPQLGLSVRFVEAVGETSQFLIDVLPVNDSLGMCGVLLKLSPVAD
jgi:two-component system, chemotaxis family, CheB/CheR fusion protein